MFLHIIATPFEHESRVLKECHAAFELEWQETAMVVALWEQGLKEEETFETDIEVWRVALRSRHWPKNLLVQVSKYIEWLYRIVARFRSSDITVIHAHSVAALPVGVVLKLFTRAPLVYDAHELESKANGLSPLRSRLTGWLERLCIRGADRVITVCDSIADWYADAYSIDRPNVVLNVPMQSAAPAVGSKVLRELHGISDDALVFLYQGALAPGRGIESLLTVFADQVGDRHLVLMGYGILENQVIAAAQKYANIHFQPAVAPSEVLRYTASADIGLCLIEDTCLSYYFSLPNKLFEYLLAGLPAMVNDMPEQRRIIEKFNCGWVMPQSSSEQANLIESIKSADYQERRRGAELASSSFDWELEAEKLRRIYRSLVSMETQ